MRTLNINKKIKLRARGGENEKKDRTRKFNFEYAEFHEQRNPSCEDLGIKQKRFRLVIRWP